MNTQNHGCQRREVLYYIGVGKRTRERETDMNDNNGMFATLPVEILIELLGNKGGTVVVERDNETGEITFSVEK